jgi:FkbM family methyltransferase
MNTLPMSVMNGNRIIRLAPQHARYQNDMRNSFDVYFNAVESHEEHGFQVVDFSEMALHRYRHNGMEFLLSSIPEEPDVVESYFQHAQGSKLAFDIGAYCGLSTYELSKRYETVIAFEPDALNRHCLFDNMRRHGMTNVTVVPSAITSKTGEAMFFAEGALGSRLALDHPFKATSIVPTMSLTDACSLYGVPDLILMDIEQAEADVLESSRELLKREKIGFAIDIHGSLRVEKILLECGYQVEVWGRNKWPNTCWAWK